MNTSNLPEEEISELEDSLKRCPEGTLEAAIAYRSTKDVKQLSVIILGIIERFIEPEFRDKLAGGKDDSLRLVEDLGVDSLTMMEIVILVEEVIGVSFDNEELKDLRTIGDVKTYMSCKASGEPIPVKSTHYPAEEIMSIMPHQSPFLFLQEASISEGNATGVYEISGKEHFLEGHFKDRPVFPASIMMESLGQLGVFYLLKGLGREIDPQSIFFTSSDGLRCHKVCEPGEKLELSVQLKRERSPLATFTGTIKAGGEKILFVEEFTLTFGSGE